MKHPPRFAFCLCLLALAVQVTQAAEPVTHGNRHRREVCLTFDACETAKPAGYDARIVAILEHAHVAATFLLGGKWMESHPDATRHLAANPQFEIGSHSYIHPHMTRVPDARIDEELSRTQDVMERLTGRRGTLFRPPYGECDDRLISRAAALGLTTITWEVVTGDPDKHVTANAIVREVLAKTRPGSIVIMHVNGRGWHTAEALPRVIAGLRAKGYRFVTVSDALRKA
jgi:peptidoglycan/xylan/chitin deacetylase (PgdA/CDA1 family)